MKRTALARNTQLKRTPMPPRRQSLAKVSKGQARQQADQRKAYGAAADAEQCWCSACGRAGATDHSHHFTQKLNRQHANDERNWLKLCRSDHDLFENHKARFAAKYPDVWASILADMEAVDPARFRAFRLKNPY